MLAWVQLRRFLMACVLVSVIGLAAFAQNPTPEQNKLLAKRAAEADAYRKLAEVVYGVQINSDTYVKDFVTESDVIRTEVDAFIKGVRLGPPKYYEDGTAEVEAEVTVATLITKLTNILATHYQGNTITITDIQNISQKLKSDIIRVKGAGVPRPELPPNLPAGVEDAITPLPQGYVPPPAATSVPPIWRAVGPQERLKAGRAAELDAVRKLLEQIKGVRINSETLVRDFITETDEIRSKAEGIVVGAYEVSKYLHTDELIVEVTMEVPVENIVTKIKELHAQHYHGNKITTTEVTNIKTTIGRDMIRATGAGVPSKAAVDGLKKQFGPQPNPGQPPAPPNMGAEEVRAIQHASLIPPWALSPIKETGVGKIDPTIGLDPFAQREKARRSARADGRVKILAQLRQIPVPPKDLVAATGITNEDRWREIEGAAISHLVSEEPVFENNECRQDVSVQGSVVWAAMSPALASK